LHDERIAKIDRTRSATINDRSGGKSGVVQPLDNYHDLDRQQLAIAQEEKSELSNRWTTTISIDNN
jgi:hypothetical protein